jgi:integrase
MIATLATAGLRRAELVALDVEHFNPETGELRVIAGKGRKDRLAYLTNGAAEAMAAWLEARGSEPGPLFVAINKGGRILGGRMTAHAVYRRLEHRRVEANVRAFSPHDLRRSFVTALLEAGADALVVQRLAGHAKPETTARYDKRGEWAKRSAAELLHFPYVAPAR